MSQPWVLVDISWLAYRAYYTMGGLEFEDLPTGIIFGVFMQLREICHSPRVRSSRIAIFCDSRSSIRARTLPTYKGKRHEMRTPEEVEMIAAMKDQRVTLQEEILPAIGFPVYMQKGLESDDLMADVASSLSNAPVYKKAGRRQAIMITSDSDLFQCITPIVHWFDPQRDVYHDPSSFAEKYGIYPSKWGEVKALAGCSTDNVPGVGGVGEGTAIKYLNGQLPPHYKAHKHICSKKGEAARLRNRELVVLPHKATEPICLREPSYNMDKFFFYCEKYGLQSILDARKGWGAFFRGLHFQTRKVGEHR